jgi:hypothetical protein
MNETPIPSNTFVAAAPPTPAPDSSVHWSSGREFAASLGRWATSFAEVRVGGACRGVAGGLWAVLRWIFWPLFYALIVFTCLVYLANAGVFQLPLPWVPTPAPVPVPSPVVGDFQSAVDADTTTDAKASRVSTLAGVMRQAVAAAKASGKIKTAADFAAFTHSATDIAVGVGKLAGLRDRIGVHVGQLLPAAATTPADDSFWAKAAPVYAEVADDLGKVKVK